MVFIKYKIVKPEQIRMMNGSGVNLDTFRKTELVPQPVFLCISRLIKSKGIFALSCPKGINSSGLSFASTFNIGLASLALSLIVVSVWDGSDSEQSSSSSSSTTN